MFVGLGILWAHKTLRHSARQSWAPSGWCDGTHWLPMWVRKDAAARMGGAIKQEPHTAVFWPLGQLKEESFPTKHQVTTWEAKWESLRSIQKRKTIYHLFRELLTGKLLLSTPVSRPRTTTNIIWAHFADKPHFNYTYNKEAPHKSELMVTSCNSEQG